MATDELTPIQQRTRSKLLDPGGERPTFAADLAIRLRDELELALGPVAVRLGVGELLVDKRRLADVLSCERYHTASRAAGFTGWSAATARGTVAHKAIELAVFHEDDPPPLDLVDAAIDRLIADERETSVGRWLETVGPAQRADVRAAANDIVVKFREAFPPLSRHWHPRTESSARVDLFDGEIVLRSKVDLALGQARGTEARVLVVDLKTGQPYSHHLDDLRFYALVHTLRTGVPPFRVASYYLESCTFHVEDVSEELLAGPTLARTIDGAIRLAHLATGERSPAITPGPQCRWCPENEACDGPAIWAARRADLGFDDEREENEQNEEVGS